MREREWLRAVGGWLSLLVCAALAVVPGAAVADDGCGVILRKEQTASSRTVLLAGGNAWELFRRYLGEAEKQQLPVSLWRSRVVVVEGQATKELSLGWIEMLTGQGAKERWSGRLRNIKSDADDGALREAERQQWDVVCQRGAPRTAAAGAKEARPGAAPEGVMAAQQAVQQGIQFAARRDYDNAVKEFSHAIKLQPTYAAAYANRGVAYMQQRKFNLAMDDFKKAVELDPRDGTIHYNLTCWYSVQRQLDRALVSLDEALANGFKDYDALRSDPELANVRSHPEWRRTLEKHKVFLQ